MIQNSKFKIEKYLLPFVLAGAFIACYYTTFLWLHYKYDYQDSYYSHGYMIPFISAYLIYLERHKLKDLEISSSKIGLVMIVFTFLLHIVATMVDINFISGFSMFFFIVGCFLYLLGGKITRELSFPILFLLFMFPIPGVYIDILGLPTKTIATTIGLGIIDLIDISYFRDGFRIQLAESTMFVGTPCNGMKSLISFAALGVLALYFLDVVIWKRIIVLIGIYPLAIFLNGTRIAALIFIADKYGIEKASPESFFHDLSGIVVFIVGLVILFLSIKLFGTDKKSKN
ncbi:exosortase/archaeosortase family protein [Desulfobacterales bacterium]|nr:exosortase/archaeosortase family protein [Desulfobacterales bacterium]